ncbi:MAG: ribonuclease P protein component [Pseudanabaenales cyanobacterium]|nr:ribonuclease P protein component [Pseudanabaenales cyanobacterium]
MALPRSNRLKHRWDFTAVYRYGKRLSTQHLYVRALGPSERPADRLQSETDKLPPARIGISISQKVSKRAVIRNRIKRRIRAALRHLLPRMRKGWRIVIVGRTPVVQCEYCQFLQELEQSLADLEVIDGY